jgi:hypothetical protein
MSLRTTKNLKLAGASCAALALTAAVTVPALAAGEFTGSTTYNCNGILPAVTFAMNTPPAKMAAGQTVKVPDKSNFTLDSGTTAFVQGSLGWSKFGGSVSSATKPDSGLALIIPKTNLGNNTGGSDPGSTTAHAAGNALLRSTKVGTYTVKFGKVDATLQGYNSDGSKHGSPVIFSDTDPNAFAPACTNTDVSGATTPQDSGSNPATVKVVKDRTHTTVGAAFAKARHQIKAITKVKSRFGLKPTGSVKVILKKGTKTIKTITSKLNSKGVATSVFKNVSKPGKYTVRASYGGSATLRGSSGSTSLTI